MPRAPRVDKADLVYHVVNRADGRKQILHTPKDYLSFEHILKEAQKRAYMRVYSSFIVSTDEYFLMLCRYIERNALRAHLTSRAEDWKWSSLWKRMYGTEEDTKFLHAWPVPIPPHYLSWLNEEEDQATLDQIRGAMNRGSPFGNDEWVQQMIQRFGLESTMRSKGRPRKST